MSDYAIERARIGILAQQEVDVVRMPRARFLALVDDLLRSGYGSLRTKLWPVAQAMATFPLGDWINEDRGCGCVVGEYLIATSELGRAELAARATRGTLRIDSLLAEDSQGGALAEFGEEIDSRIRREVGPDPGSQRYPDAVLIVDPS